MGATLLKQAARQTVQEAGDGTTTATVLAHALLKNSYKKDVNTRELKEGINSGVDKVISYLEKNSTPVVGEMIDQVATISANNDKQIGGIIADAFRAVDNTGVVMMEVNDQPETFCEVVDGVQYYKGFKNDSFITDKLKGTAELENPLVLIVESLIPKSLKTQLYKAIRDSFASEHGARMTAMHKATDNATELRDQLTLSYNKARQAAITNEILEIVGGAEALNN